MATKYQIALYWSSPEGRARCPQMLTFLDSPSCFACHYCAEGWSKPKSFENRWERARLDRAHIIAHGIGGSDRATNLVLLCRPCHDAAPMLNDEQKLFAWMLRRPKCLFGFPIHEVLAELGPHVRAIEREFRGLDDHLVRQRLYQSARDLQVGQHFGPKGPRVTAASWAAVVMHAADFLKQQRSGRRKRRPV